MKETMTLPILFGIIFIVLVGCYGAVFFIIPIPLVFKLVVGVVMTVIAGAMVYVIIERKREMQEEDKDDISKY